MGTYDERLIIRMSYQNLFYIWEDRQVPDGITPGQDVFLGIKTGKVLSQGKRVVKMDKNRNTKQKWVNRKTLREENER